MQAELKAATAPALQKAVPGLTDELVDQMKVAPLRQFDPQLIQDPLVYRLYEVTHHQLSSTCLLSLTDKGGHSLRTRWFKLTHTSDACCK